MASSSSAVAVQRDVAHRSVDFEAFLQMKKKEIMTVDGKQAFYISPADLEDHWETEAITRELNSFVGPSIATTADAIQQNNRIIWSILLHIGQPKYIVDFIRREWDDANLPMESELGPFRPEEPISLPAREMLDAFRKEQWFFCPLRFKRKLMAGKKLDERCILPVKYERVLTGNPSEAFRTIVREVVIDGDCCEPGFDAVSFEPPATSFPFGTDNSPAEGRVQGIPG
jgi:hypothetical protein